MEDAPPTSSEPLPSQVAPELANPRPRPAFAERVVALIEVVLCSDFPTQLTLVATFSAFGFTPRAADGTLRIDYVVALSLADTVFLLSLIVLFLLSHGERPRDVFFGNRPILREGLAGVPLTLLAFVIAVGAILLLQRLAPSLHTVPHNPLQDFLRTPGSVALFAVVVVIAGGVREELQRAFLLRRFERWLGGPRLGVVVTSAAFGAGHWIQGADAAVATGLLGAFWAVVYLRRGSAAAPVVSHSGFNLLQLAQFVALGH
jgi:membrane protease YdiL (CAAX protease family)